MTAVTSAAVDGMVLTRRAGATEWVIPRSEFALKAGESSMRPEDAVAALTMTSGTMRLAFFTAKVTETILSVNAFSDTTAAGATPTLIRIGIWEEDASSGDLTPVASTANDTTLLAAASQTYPKALQASWAKVEGHRYATGLLVVTGAAAPTVPGRTLRGSVGNYRANNPRITGAISGLTDLPSGTISRATIANSGNGPYLEMLTT